MPIKKSPPPAEPVHFVVFNPNHPISGREMVGAVEQEIKLNSGKPVIIGFPETVFGPEPMERSKTKEILRRVHEILATHGNAYVVFSAFEHTGGPKTKSVSNTGYVVLPKREKVLVPRRNNAPELVEKQGWMAYPKVYYYRVRKTKSRVPRGEVPVFTYKEKPSHLALGEFDSQAYLSKSRIPARLDPWIGRSRKIKDFPKFHVDGANIDVQLRVCADITDSLNAELKTNKSASRADFIIVPAEGLGRDIVEEQMEKALKFKGRELQVLVIDKDRGVKVVSGRENAFWRRLLFRVPRRRIMSHEIPRGSSWSYGDKFRVTRKPMP